MHQNKIQYLSAMAKLPFVLNGFFLYLLFIAAQALASPISCFGFCAQCIIVAFLRLSCNSAAVIALQYYCNCINTVHISLQLLYVCMCTHVSSSSESRKILELPETLRSICVNLNDLRWEYFGEVFGQFQFHHNYIWVQLGADDIPGQKRKAKSGCADNILARTKEGEEIEQETSPDLDEEVRKSKIIQLLQLPCVKKTNKKLPWIKKLLWVKKLPWTSVRIWPNCDDCTPHIRHSFFHNPILRPKKFLHPKV